MLLRLPKELDKLTLAGSLGLHVLCSPVLPMTAYGAFLHRAGVGLGPSYFSRLLSLCFQVHTCQLHQHGWNKPVVHGKQSYRGCKQWVSWSFCLCINTTTVRCILSAGVYSRWCCKEQKQDSKTLHATWGLQCQQWESSHKLSTADLQE